MPDQPDHPTDVPQNFERQILMLLLWSGGSSTEEWWSLEDLVHRVGDPIVALDAMHALSNAGLIHRQGEFVFPTRAASYYFELLG
jgi:membrane-associated PAP2 superfamily phosphatase